MLHFLGMGLAHRINPLMCHNSENSPADPELRSLYRINLEFSTAVSFSRDFVLKQFPKKVAGDESAEPQLSDAATSIKIRLQVNKIQTKVLSIH